MTTRDELREKVARAIFEELDVLGISVTPEEETRLGKAALAVVRAELAEPSEAMMQHASDAIAWAYVERDWEEAKEMAEDLDPRVIYDAIFAASPLAEPGA